MYTMQGLDLSDQLGQWQEKDNKREKRVWRKEILQEMCECTENSFIFQTNIELSL